MEDNKIPKCGCCHTGENISETDFGYTLSLINGKYKLVIIYWLEQHDNVMRYSEKDVSEIFHIRHSVRL